MRKRQQIDPSQLNALDLLERPQAPIPEPAAMLEGESKKKKKQVIQGEWFEEWERWYSLPKEQKRREMWEWFQEWLASPDKIQRW